MNKALKTLTRIALVIVGMLVVVVIIPNLMAGHRLRRVLRAVEQAGRPMTPEAVIPDAVPDAENAAPLYIKAATVLEEQLTPQFEDGIPEADQLTNGALQQARAVLAMPEAAEVAALLEQAAARPACRYDLDYAAGVYMALPHVARARALSRFISLEAAVQAHDARPREAYATLQKALKLADTLRREPLIISALVRMAQIHLTLEALQFATQHAPPSPAERKALQAQLLALTDNAPLIQAMDGERILFGDWTFTRVITRTGADLGALSELQYLAGVTHRYVPGGFLLRAVLVYDRATYLDLMLRMTEDAGRPFYDLPDRDEIFEAIPRFCILTRMILPALGGVQARHAETEARLLMAHLALDLLAQHEATGAFPESLATLTTALTDTQRRDPCDGKPLRYARRDNGFILYSTGTGRKDDGGVVETDRDKPRDVVYAYAPMQSAKATE